MYKLGNTHPSEMGQLESIAQQLCNIANEMNIANKLKLTELTNSLGLTPDLQKIGAETWRNHEN